MIDSARVILHMPGVQNLCDDAILNTAVRPAAAAAACAAYDRSEEAAGPGVPNNPCQG